jgi:hypothetical protein
VTFPSIFTFVRSKWVWALICGFREKPSLEKSSSNALSKSFWKSFGKVNEMGIVCGSTMSCSSPADASSCEEEQAPQATPRIRRNGTVQAARTRM